MKTCVQTFISSKQRQKLHRLKRFFSQATWESITANPFISAHEHVSVLLLWLRAEGRISTSMLKKNRCSKRGYGGGYKLGSWPSGFGTWRCLFWESRSPGKNFKPSVRRFVLLTNSSWLSFYGNCGRYSLNMLLGHFIRQAIVTLPISCLTRHI